MEKLSVSLSDVEQAARRICRSEYVQKSPLLDMPEIARAFGFASLRVKNETVHPIGAFKIRGAMNHFLQLTDEQKRRGVFAISYGNHAQAVAYAARQFGVAATILMPADAPKLKLENTRGYGAEVITFDRVNQDREDIGRRIAAERGLHLIHPYNDPVTIAGQGTSGIEIFEQTKDVAPPDAIIVPCSGGGLAAGIALTRDLYKTPPQIFTAEPAAFDDALRSLKSGKSVVNSGEGRSVCDALMAPAPGSHTLPVLLHHKAQGFAVSDDEAFAGMAIADKYMGGLKLEPSGAVALACVLHNRDRLKGQNVVVIASGANVDPDVYPGMIEKGRETLVRLYPGLSL